MESNPPYLKIIKLIIENNNNTESFVDQIIDIIKPVYFDNLYNRILCDYILKYYTKYLSFRKFIL